MKLFFREKGNSSLPPLILLHGLWGASDNWLPIARLLANYFHVILPDFRNHGNSPHSDEYDYDILSQDIEDFISFLQLPQKPFIAGHSMGGKALMLLLLKRPEITSKAVIIDICPHEYDSVQENIHSQLLDFILKTPLTSLNREKIQAMIRDAFPEEEHYQLLVKNIRKTDNGYEWKINAQALQKNLQALTGWPHLAPARPYTSPLLFIRGEYSDYIPAKLPVTTLRLFPAADLTTIPKASHRIHADQPFILAQALIDYLT